jgi:hypothetical protein
MPTPSPDGDGHEPASPQPIVELLNHTVPPDERAHGTGGGAESRPITR